MRALKAFFPGLLLVTATGCGQILGFWQDFKPAEDNGVGGTGGTGGTGGAGGGTALGGQVLWARAFAGEGMQEGPHVTATGSDAAVLVGRLAGSVDFDGNVVQSVGADNLFWARVGVDGKAAAAKRFGWFDPQLGHSVALDVSGDVLVSGEFSGQADFGGAPLPSAGGRDGYVAKLDEAGAQVWLQPLGGIGYQTGLSADGGDQGQTVVVGRFTGKITIGMETLASAGGYDLFVAQFDETGQPAWARRAGDGFDQGSRAVAVDAVGNVIVTGEFAGTIDLGGGPLVSAGDYDMFVAKLNVLGEHVWSKRFGDAGLDRARAIAVDGAGNVILGGEFTGTIDLGGGPRTAKEGGQAAFVAKLGADGSHMWSRRIGENGVTSLEGLAVDGAGNVVAVGEATGLIKVGKEELPSAGGEDAFALKLDPAGRVGWAKRFGGAGADRGTGVAVDGNGNVLIAGAFEGQVDFGGKTLASGDEADVFLVKVGP